MPKILGHGKTLLILPISDALDNTLAMFKHREIATTEKNKLLESNF